MLSDNPKKKYFLAKFWLRRVLLPLSFESAYECRSPRVALEDDIGGEFDRTDRLMAGYLFFPHQPRTLAAPFRRPQFWLSASRYARLVN